MLAASRDMQRGLGLTGRRVTFCSWDSSESFCFSCPVVLGRAVCRTDSKAQSQADYARIRLQNNCLTENGLGEGRVCVSM